ncbi:MAG: multiheme c-type cytochrome [Bradymonadaceae bacterium]
MPRPDSATAPDLSTVSASALALLLAVAASDCDRTETSSSSSAKQSESSTSHGGSNSEHSTGDLPGDKPPGSVEPPSPGPPAPAVFFTAGLKGYLEPCGCSADVLLGGAERVAGYVRNVRRRLPATAVLDAGDVLFQHETLETHRVPQARAKSEVVGSLLKSLGTVATVPGERDFALGPETYLEAMRSADVTPLAVNLDVEGADLAGTTVVSLGDWRLGVVWAVEPALFEDVDGASASPVDGRLGPAVATLRDEKKVDAVLALVHGRLGFVRALLSNHSGIDFGVVGHGPRETDQVQSVGDGYTLEAFTQGRYVGLLKLYGRDRQGPFVRAYEGSETELQKVEQQIDHVEETISELSPDEEGAQAPPLLDRMKERLEDLKNRRSELKQAEIEVPESRQSFLFRPIPIEPGYPIVEAIRQRRVEYNRQLEELNRQVSRQVPRPADGAPTYLGTNQCKSCHRPAHDFWKGTRHATALQTLQKRDKAFDQRCIGCHVVGYDEPGGSVLGKLTYERKVDGRRLRKDLRNVGCESCHGPGSKHRENPAADPASLEGFVADPGVEQCKQCHVPDHSPGFDFETYVDKITGDGHPRDSQ